MTHLFYRKLESVLLLLSGFAGKVIVLEKLSEENIRTILSRAVNSLDVRIVADDSSVTEKGDFQEQPNRIRGFSSKGRDTACGKSH